MVTGRVADEEAVEKATQEVYDTIQAHRSELEAEPDKVEDLINSTIAPLIDFEIMGRMVLGKHWRNATGDQRRERHALRADVAVG